MRYTQFAMNLIGLSCIADECEKALHQAKKLASNTRHNNIPCSMNFYQANHNNLLFMQCTTHTKVYSVCFLFLSLYKFNNFFFFSIGIIHFLLNSINFYKNRNEKEIIFFYFISFHKAREKIMRNCKISDILFMENKFLMCK